MAEPNSFAPRNDGDVVRLVSDYPLSWMFLQDASGPFATPVPLRPVIVENQLHKLVGRIPREGRAARYLGQPAQGLIIVLGPHGYVSPSWMSDRAQAPTWNYTSAQFVAEIRIVDDATFLDAHLRDLTEALEQTMVDPCHMDELGARREILAARIVTIEAAIVSTAGRFKLGQDENDRTYREISGALQDAGKEELLSWMWRYNRSRD